jgi:hypothetical protein
MEQEDTKDIGYLIACDISDSTSLVEEVLSTARRDFSGLNPAVTLIGSRIAARISPTNLTTKPSAVVYIANMAWSSRNGTALLD